MLEYLVSQTPAAPLAHKAVAMSSIGREVSGLGLVERGRLLVLLEGDYGVTTKINAVVEVLGFETEGKIKVALIDETDGFQPVDQLATVEVPASCLKVLTIEPSFVAKGMALAQEAHHKFFVPVVTTNPRDAHKSLDKCMSMLKEAVTLNPLNGEAWAYIMNVAEFRNSNQPVPNATGLVLTRGDQAVDFLYLQAGLRACGNLPPVAENQMLHASLRLNLAGALGNPPVNAFADEEVQLRYIMDHCVPAGTRCMTLDRMLAQALRKQERFVEAAEVLRGQRRQPHLWRVFNGRSLAAPATREDGEDFLSEFPKVAFGLWNLANKFSIRADGIYAGPGGTANTLASVEAYLEALCLLRKSMVYLDDNDQATLLLASRAVLKLNRHLMWKTISTQFGSREAFL